MRIFLGPILPVPETSIGTAMKHVLEQILWHTLKHALEPLKAVVEEELRRLEGG